MILDSNKEVTALFDYIIRQVRIVDGTGSPWTIGDVAVQEGIIAAMGKHIAVGAHEIIDGRGLTLTPGFIDIHTHSDFSLLLDGSAASRLLQGVTTEIGGNCGMSPAPVAPERVDMLKEYTAFFGHGINYHWQTYAEFLDALAAQRPAVNFGGLVGHGTLRIAAMGFDNRQPTAGELEKMQQLLDESMQAGAFGMSTGLIYAPGCYADTNELAKVAAAVAPYGGIYETHMRNEGEHLLESIEEAAEIGRRSGARVQIAHHKVVGRLNWGKGKQSQALIAQLRAQGLDIANDQYPYTASATTITTIFPDWAHVGGVDGLLARLSNPDQRTAIRTAVLESMEKRAERFEDILISEVKTAANKHFEGMTVAEAALSVGQEAIDFVIDLVLAERAGVSAVTFAMCEEDVQTILAHPLTMIGSDGASIAMSCSGTPHPRNFGTFARVLSKYVQVGLFSFEEGVRKMTAAPAGRLGLFNRGLIRPGMAADLVLLASDELRDNGTFNEPKQAPSGILKVWVNGQLAVTDGQLTGARAGQILRRQ